jgi:hypothetical protein
VSRVSYKARVHTLKYVERRMWLGTEMNVWEYERSSVYIGAPCLSLPDDFTMSQGI